MANPATGKKGIQTRTKWGNFERWHADSYRDWLMAIGVSST